MDVIQTPVMIWCWLSELLKRINPAAGLATKGCTGFKQEIIHQNLRNVYMRKQRKNWNGIRKDRMVRLRWRRVNTESQIRELHTHKILRIANIRPNRNSRMSIC
jgi:hypothetical protein